MKTLIKTIILMLTLVLITNCSDNVSDPEDNISLSQADQEEFDQMEMNYELAVEYTDSLQYCHEFNHEYCNDEFIRRCDSLYHHHENRWEHHHNRYSHDSTYGNHYHDGNKMHNRDQNSRNLRGHQMIHHEYMDQLRDRHMLYHPNFD